MDILIVILLILVLAFVILLFFRCCRKKESPSAQVVNNSGTLIHKVRVGGVEFTEHLGECADGCSTGFINVPEGANVIQLQQTSGGAWSDLGVLAPFEKGLYYSVNIKTQGSFCAELWILGQTSIRFNDNTSKVFVASNCP